MKMFFSSKKSKPSAKLIASFFQQLATLMTANIPLSQSCQLLSQAQTNLPLQKIIHSLQRDIEAGQGLSTGLKKFPHLFNELICQLVYLGEISGTLEKILQQISIILEKSLSIKTQIKQALFYPLTVLCIALLVCFMMLIFIVPQFGDFFQNFHGQLPLLTRCIMRLSCWVREDYDIGMIAIIGCIFLYNSIRKKSHDWFFQLPLISYLSTRFFIIHFAKNLSLVYAAGMSMTDGLKLIAQTCRLPLHKATINHIKEKISSGQQLNMAIKSCSLFPQVVTHMVRIGEESGTLHKMLDAIENLFAAELNEIIVKMTQLLEPLIMVILGALIGGLVIAMYLPIFKLGMTI